MGQFFKCEVCGKREKGFAPDCNCYYKRNKKISKKREGSTILGSFTALYNRYSLYLYECLEKDGETFYAKMSLQAPDCGYWQEIDGYEYADKKEYSDLEEDSSEEEAHCEGETSEEEAHREEINEAHLRRIHEDKLEDYSEDSEEAYRGYYEGKTSEEVNEAYLRRTHDNKLVVVDKLKDSAEEGLSKEVNEAYLRRIYEEFLKENVDF